MSSEQPLPLAFEAIMLGDYSEAAAQRCADELVQRYGQGAYAVACDYRRANPAPAQWVFWSRVILRVIAPAPPPDTVEEKRQEVVRLAARVVELTGDPAMYFYLGQLAFAVEDYRRAGGRIE